MAIMTGLSGNEMYCLHLKGLRPGDKLTFFIPDDRLTANFSNDDTTSAPMEEVPIVEPVQETAMAPAEAAIEAPEATADGAWLSTATIPVTDAEPVAPAPSVTVNVAV